MQTCGTGLPAQPHLILQFLPGRQVQAGAGNHIQPIESRTRPLQRLFGSCQRLSPVASNRPVSDCPLTHQGSGAVNPIQCNARLRNRGHRSGLSGKYHDLRALNRFHFARFHHGMRNGISRSRRQGFPHKKPSFGEQREFCQGFDWISQERRWQTTGLNQNFVHLRSGAVHRLPAKSAPHDPGSFHSTRISPPAPGWPMRGSG
ncbi:hypothetical protein DFP90_1105 [Aestuariispira insulae]|uniref:Uncharacterized protein n=1 Tax=Aestuariispira insulae TaxID=1461337 RepID=A0A3D9H9E2_9PROT|nr:hypothetical protein DFP90_1105 [Aestuariispira insulae]